MPKHLVLKPDPTVNWRLPAGTDVEDLRTRLRVAMEDETVIAVDVEMNDNPLVAVPLLVNGRNLVAAAVVELPSQDES
jgi:hypothetical protein